MNHTSRLDLGALHPVSSKKLFPGLAIQPQLLLQLSSAVTRLEVSIVHERRRCRPSELFGERHFPRFYPVRTRA